MVSTGTFVVFQQTVLTNRTSKNRIPINATGTIRLAAKKLFAFPIVYLSQVQEFKFWARISVVSPVTLHFFGSTGEYFKVST